MRTVSLLLASLLTAVAAHTAVAGRVAPGTDLTRPTGSARDGATLTLGPGTYAGQIYVDGKTLTVRGDPAGGTVLAGDVQILVAVVGGGRLTLENVTFRPRAGDGIAVFVRGSEARVADCRARGAEQPVFYVEAGRLEVARCRVQDSANDGIRALDGADVTVSESIFWGLGGVGVYLDKGSSAGITASLFEELGRPAVYATGQSRLTVKTVRFAGVSDAVVVHDGSRGDFSGAVFENIDGTALAVLAGARVEVADSRFRRARTGIYGGEGASVTVADTTFAAIGGEAVFGANVETLSVRASTFEDVGSAGVAFRGDGRLRVEGSRFSRVALAIATTKGAARADVHGNVIAEPGGEQAAIAIATSGPVAITGNRIVGPYAGIRVSGARVAAAEIRTNTVLNARVAGISVDAPAGGGAAAITVAGNRVIGAGEAGLVLAGAAEVAVSDNVVVSDGKLGVLVSETAASTLAGNTVVAAGAPLVVDDGAGARARVEDDVLLTTGESAGYAAGRIDAAPSQRRLARALTGGEARERLSVAAAALLEAAGGATAEPSAALESAVAALGDVAADVRTLAVNTASVTVEIVDALGQSFFAPFALLDAESNTLSTYDEAEPTAAVAPGVYVVEPVFDPLLAREVELRAGQSRMVRIEAPEHVGLVVKRYDSNAGGTVRTRLPLRFKGRAAMRRALASPPPRAPARRAGASAEAVAAALALARQRLEAVLALRREAVDAYNRALDATMTASAAMFERLRRDAARGENPWTWAGRILLIAGEAADAARLVALARAQAESWDRDELVELAAQIENRLGILDTGAVAALLADADAGLAFVAARVLHAHGSAAGDAVLSARLRAAESAFSTALAAKTLLDTDGPEVRAAMVALLRAAAAVPGEKDTYYLGEAGGYAALYLLAYGNEAERRLAAAYPIADDGLVLLAGMVADPRPVINFSLGLGAGQSASFDPELAARFCPRIALLPRPDAERIERYVEDALVRLAVEQDISGYGSGNANALLARWRYDLARGECRTSRYVAQLIHSARFTPSGFHRRLEEHHWIPRTWAADDLIAAFIAGDALLDDQLGYLPHEQIVAALADGRAGPNVPEADLFVAYHAIGADACWPGRCAFALTNADNPKGTLAAVVRVRPTFVERTLRVELAFDLAAYTEGGLAAMISPPTRSYEGYLASRGETLITGVTASRGATSIALAPAGRAPDGEGLVFEGTLEAVDLSDLYLHVALQVLDTPWTLDFALFATDEAKALTRARARASAAAQAVAADERDAAGWIAWGDALGAMGQVEAARGKYERALALRPGDVALWARVADALATRGQTAAARALLAEGVAANPDALGLVLKLANLHYRAGAYDAASEAYGRVAARRANDPRWRWWEALSRFLAGAYGEASAILSGLGGGYQALRTPLLRYLAARLGGTTDAAAAEAALRALAEAAPESPEGHLYGLLLGTVEPERALEGVSTTEGLCRARVALGYRALLADDGASSRDHLDAAERACRAGGIEHRLARTALARLLEPQ